MRAAFLTGQRTLDLRDMPAPDVPTDGFVMKVIACGICGSDLRRWKEGPVPGTDPVIPGHEAAGVVTETGSDCADFSVGDYVAIAPDIHCGRCYYCDRDLYNLCDDLRLLGITPGYPGGFAEKMAIDGNTIVNGIVHKMPAGLSFMHAAVSEPASSVLAAQAKAQIAAGDAVVVIGAGPTGCLHVAAAKQRQAKVIVSQRSKARQEMVRSFGPDLVIDASTQDVVACVRTFTGGIGADVVICANPVAQTQKLAVEMVRKAGKVMLFGGLPKADPMTILNGNLIHYGEIEVVGAFSYHPKYHRQALDLLAEGALPAQQLITHTFDLDDISRAYETAASSQALKVVVEIGRHEQ